MTNPNKLWANLLIRLMQNPKLCAFTFPHEQVFCVGYAYLSSMPAPPSPHAMFIWSWQVCSSCGMVSTNRAIDPCTPCCNHCARPTTVSPILANFCKSVNFALSTRSSSEKSYLQSIMQTMLTNS